ncbi:hypothetical protein PILCRDRAFT_547868 [Piloderma croceum F 1598]|uniref:Uncharacterized protein n=1 Tax=Piloderma croceum (strain F 1598) TaxID=765440 RepID=A0A0C3BRC3_PILCF|nr:hypothetical protein PILCRDRAFT_547868 [Piloderma croceum F 1598]
MRSMSDPGVIFANAHPICHINGHGSDAFVIACLTPQAFFSGQPHLKHNHPKISPAERRVFISVRPLVIKRSLCNLTAVLHSISHKPSPSFAGSQLMPSPTSQIT